MGGHGTERRPDREAKPSAMEILRASGALPTASSAFSFTKPPMEDWNFCPVFSQAKRMNHAASANFLGTFYQQAEDRGISFPGPGSYNLENRENALVTPGASATRPSTFNRRSRISVAPMMGSRLTASLAGADKVTLEATPDFPGAPPTEMDAAASAKGYLTAAFASETGRFPRFGMHIGPHEPRKCVVYLANTAAARCLAGSTAHSFLNLAPRHLSPRHLPVTPALEPITSGNLPCA